MKSASILSNINTSNTSSDHDIPRQSDTSDTSSKYTQTQFQPLENVDEDNRFLARLVAVPPQPPSNNAFSGSPITPSTPIAQHRKPSEAGLHLRTNLSTSPKRTNAQAQGGLPEISHPISNDVETPKTLSLQHTRSFDSIASIYSTTSSVPSPALAALTDVTPLPSPLLLANSPELWRKLVGRPHSGSNASLSSYARDEMAGYLSTAARSMSPTRKKKVYTGLGISAAGGALERVEQGGPSRTISEYVPDPLVIARPRTTSVSGSAAFPQSSNQLSPPLERYEQHMHREQYLAKQRGLVQEEKARSSPLLPTPPLSKRTTSDDQEEQAQSGQAEYGDLLVVGDAQSHVKNYWRTIRRLGQGAFSEVFLAKRERASNPEFVAIKIVSHVPTGRNDEERMETSIKREVEILQNISHPCLPQLKAFENNDKRALLVLNYCPGGDLFELASQRRSSLTPSLIQRIFAEMVAAVGYLHSHFIVHRDIKLENVLFNIPASHLRNLPTPISAYPYPLITLTDLGLSKQIPVPPASPLLTHACGSADYAAPELLLGQPYDGRLTDAWALGVLLYALMEGRLPFDPLPVSDSMSAVEQRRRRRGQHVGVKHRIARCDWVWCEFGNDDGEWVGRRGEEGLDGAREVVEGCLKKVNRGRWTVLRCSEAEWVRDGLQVEGGLRTKV